MGDVIQFIPKPNPERLQKAYDDVCRALIVDGVFNIRCNKILHKTYGPITDHKEYPQEPA